MFKAVGLLKCIDTSGAEDRLIKNKIYIEIKNPVSLDFVNLLKDEKYPYTDWFKYRFIKIKFKKLGKLLYEQ
jgi:hypothetical protein